MALIFQLIGFVSNGWIIRSSFDNTYRHGVYCGTQRDALKTQVVKPHLCMKSMLIITTCVENTGCETSSWYEQFAGHRDDKLLILAILH